MKSITIDLTRYYAEFERPPHEDETANWTFIIDEDPITLYGTYAEAASMARLYVRLTDSDSGLIRLAGHSPAGHVHISLN